MMIKEVLDLFDGSTKIKVIDSKVGSDGWTCYYEGLIHDIPYRLIFHSFKKLVIMNGILIIDIHED